MVNPVEEHPAPQEEPGAGGHDPTKNAGQAVRKGNKIEEQRAGGWGR
jgi:hypothetical protein